jgi:hypothetical protein
MGNLRSQLEQIAETFVSAVLAAMQSAPLSDLAVETGRSGRSATAAKIPAAAPTAQIGKKRRRRASAAEVQKQKDAALAAARALKPGFSKGEVMAKSGSKIGG